MPKPKPALGIRQQWLDACVRAAIANHYLVTVKPPLSFDYEDALAVSNEIVSKEAVGRLSHALATRALILLSESSGYSLTDLNV